MNASLLIETAEAEATAIATPSLAWTKSMKMQSLIAIGSPLGPQCSLISRTALKSVQAAVDRASTPNTPLTVLTGRNASHRPVAALRNAETFSTQSSFDSRTFGASPFA
jgi:hypothetical protein